MTVFTCSNIATLMLVLYISFAFANLYRLMFPLSAIREISSDGAVSKLVKNVWECEAPVRMKIYLSVRRKFTLDFLDIDHQGIETEASAGQQRALSSRKHTVLLWETSRSDSRKASLAKSLILDSNSCEKSGTCDTDSSYQEAKFWLDSLNERLEDRGGFWADLKRAGSGTDIQSTSILLTLYGSLSRVVAALWNKAAGTEPRSKQPSPKDGVTTIPFELDSHLWRALRSNSTVYLHVVVTREDPLHARAITVAEEKEALRRSSRSHSLLMGNVELVNFLPPFHIPVPGRPLLNDVLFLVTKYLLGYYQVQPPWDMRASTKYQEFEEAKRQRKEGASSPYWKPQVAVKYVHDNSQYPMDLVDMSGLPYVGIKSPDHPSGLGLLPALHVDEIGLTSEKYIPLNESVTALPLYISFDRSDMEFQRKSGGTSLSSGAMSPARWRLLVHLSQAIENQRELGFELDDIDDLRRLIGETSVVLLAITVVASGLHLLFEFLTFKNEISFWSNNTDLTGLSVRSLFLDLLGQFIILMFLIEKNSSLLMTIPTAGGCVVALYKCYRGAGLTVALLPRESDETSETASSISMIFQLLPVLQVRAIRLEKGDGRDKADKLRNLSIETDRIATKTLSIALIPIVCGYALYSLVFEEHRGWYSWLITSASTATYAGGFILMTPQLFLNYKLKSVAHLPWKVLIYKFLNTFIDDLFAFIIRMPTLSRLGVFRDDIVFVIYLYQRWLYPVDMSRPVEGGGHVSQKTDSSKKKEE